MRVIWLCSRRVKGQVSGYYTEKQIVSEKEMVRTELLNMMHRQSKRDTELLKKGSAFFSGTMFCYSETDSRQDKCIKELFRCKDGEDFLDILEDKTRVKNDYTEKSSVKDMKEALNKYIFTCYKTMYMPVTVSVPDDSTEDDIKKALFDKMSQNYDYENDPYHLIAEILPVPACAAWEEELTLADRIEQGLDDISTLYMYEYEWLKYYKKSISGRYYDDEYEIDWESMQQIPYNEFEEPETDREETDDYWYERSDVDSPEEE